MSGPAATRPPKGEDVKTSESIHMRVLLDYELEPTGCSEAAEQILLALRNALPGIRTKALLRTFEAQILQTDRDVTTALKGRTRSHHLGSTGCRYNDKE